MKVLFVCRGNVARSQIAEALYNQITKTSDASSAGTQVDHPGETLCARKKRVGASNAVDVMNDYGLSPNNKVQKQLTKDNLKEYDLVVSMAGKRYTPKWLSTSPKYRYWKISDPKARGYKVTEKTMKQIEYNIRNLLLG
ncbi:low molecular weight phosphatase family protein [Candidatus Saccharibacteria bacterium]|nr:low molecular weight phosphatase family protein [Candidatus Saccharibacteria bacterium]